MIAIILTNKSGKKGPVSNAKGIKHNNAEERLINEFLSIQILYL